MLTKYRETDKFYRRTECVWLSILTKTFKSYQLSCKRRLRLIRCIWWWRQQRRNWNGEKTRSDCQMQYWHWTQYQRTTIFRETFGIW